MDVQRLSRQKLQLLSPTRLLLPILNSHRLLQPRLSSIHLLQPPSSNRQLSRHCQQLQSHVLPLLSAAELSLQAATASEPKSTLISESPESAPVHP